MKKRVLLAIFAVAFLPTPTYGRCFSRWNYPWPQHCAAGHRAPLRPHRALAHPTLAQREEGQPPASPALPAPTPPPNIPDVPLDGLCCIGDDFVAHPPNPDQAARNKAIEELKSRLGGQK